MSTELKSVIFCPDCGGIVGATEGSDRGKACRCFAEQAKRQAAALAERAAPTPEPRLDADDEPSAGSGGESATGNGTAMADVQAPKVEKLCALCGKNVAGHRRLKDSRGYICLDCARAEQARQIVQGAECPKCHRRVKEDTIKLHDGQRMCQRCLREAREVARPGSKKYRKIDDKHFETSSKKQVIILSIVAGVLALLMVAGWLSR